MATKKEIAQHLKLALKEIGEIKPWFDKNVHSWVFESPLYPVGYAANDKEEVVKNYPLHLREFILERLNNNLNPLIEKDTKGHGGSRIGAGRPKGSIKPPTTQVRLPVDIATWLKQPGMISHIREMLKGYHPRSFTS